MGTLNDKKKQKYYLIFSGLAVAFLMGCRYPAYYIVYDLSFYFNYYKRLSLIPWSQVLKYSLLEYSNMEYGYVFMNKVLVTIIPWPQFILIFEAGFCVFSISRFIYKYSEYPFWGMLFYVTLGAMNFQLTAFRQAFAIGICLFSIDFIKQKKPIKFILTVLLAVTFHKTAIIFFPFYFFANRKPNWKNNLFYIITTAVVVYSSDWITNIGNELLDMNYGGYIGNTFGGLIPIFIYSITIILSWWYQKRDCKSIALNMTEIGLGIYLMRYTTLALERVSFFYTPGVIITLPNVLHCEKDHRYQFLIKLSALILAISLFGYRLTTSEWANYRFFWQ